MMSKLKAQFAILVILFLLAEIVLRCFGMKAGTLIDDLKIQENPVYIPRFYSDSMGINHLLPALLINGTILNRQGFRGLFDYTLEVVDSVRKNTKKEIIMVVGDSYVEGCCPDSVSNSFPDILNRDPRYQVLNFGVGGTDPLQYELVVKKYVPLLKPDKVIIVVYFGNDITCYDRVASPGIPLTFPFKNNKWLFEVAPMHRSEAFNYNFKSAEEAYTFFIDNYTLRGKNRNVFEKTISYSVIFSKIYLGIEGKLVLRSWQKRHPNYFIDGNLIVYHNLKKIQHTCDSAKIPCIFVGVPSPGEAKEGEKLKTKYKDVFKELPWYAPGDLSIKDYDGPELGNHFNNQGSLKYAIFLRSVLEGSESLK